MNEVSIVDVGHGNCAIVRSGDAVTTIDSARREHLVEALRAEGLFEIHAAIASHSDEDHCAGIIGLLLDEDFSVREVRMNPDATRAGRTEFWDDLKVAVRAARDRCGTRLRTELTTESTADISFNTVLLEVLYPPPELAIDGVGSQTEDGVRITANAMSAVIRVVLDGTPRVLLTGDMDRAALDFMVEADSDMRATVLVFPHHGGVPERAKSDKAMREFTKTLAAHVQPEHVVFSLGRNEHSTPQPLIVEELRASLPGAHIACTQLSSRCSDELLASATHLGSRYAGGREAGLCCAGTVVISSAEGLVAPRLADHQGVLEEMTDRLCGHTAASVPVAVGQRSGGLGRTTPPDETSSAGN